MPILITKADLGMDANRDDAMRAVKELRELGWDVQYGDGLYWRETLAEDPDALLEFEQDLRDMTSSHG
jgi:hypothetical protein